MGTGSPLNIRSPYGATIDGIGAMVFQQRVLGEYKGLKELSRILEVRETELREMISKQQQEDEERRQST